jgi:hypothetical protein
MSAKKKAKGAKAAAEAPRLTAEEELSRTRAELESLRRLLEIRTHEVRAGGGGSGGGGGRTRPGALPQCTQLLRSDIAAASSRRRAGRRGAPLGARLA